MSDKDNRAPVTFPILEYGKVPSDTGSAQAAILGQAHWASVGKLTPGIMHEINNALCVIGNYVQLLMLQSEDRGWDIPKPLQVMRQNIDRVRAAAHRFAAYARPSVGRPCLFRITDLLDNAIALALFQKPFQDLNIRKEFAQDLPEIEGNPGPLTDAFVEILTAAGEAIPRGGTLAISTHSTPGWAMVRFSGVGQGPQPDGNLTLARHIIEQQGGRLVYEWDCAPFVVGVAPDPVRPDMGSVTGLQLVLPLRVDLSPHTGRWNSGGDPDLR